MAGKSGDQNRRAPHRGQRRQGYPATPGQAPRSVQDCTLAPAPLGFSPGDARGEAPCIRKPKNSPFPTGEGGRGGDRGKKFMMRQAQPATETAAPHRGQRRQGYPATPGQAPRSVQDCTLAPAPLGFSPGDARGEAPCIRKPKNSPFPGGEGGWGDRGKKLMMRQVQPATEKSSHPSKPTVAKKTVSRRRRTPLPPCSQSTSSTRQSGRTVRSDGCSTYRRISLKAEA